MNNNNGESMDASDHPTGMALNDDDVKLVGSRLFVGKINEKITREIIENRFAKYGRVIGVTMHRDYCFVQYEDERASHSAIKGENGSIMFGDKLVVRMEKDQQPNKEKSQFVSSPRKRSPSVDGRRDNRSSGYRPTYRERSPPSLRGSRDGYDNCSYRRDGDSRHSDRGSDHFRAPSDRNSRSRFDSPPRDRSRIVNPFFNVRQPENRDIPPQYRARDFHENYVDYVQPSKPNDCEVIVMNRPQRPYAELVERKLKSAGLQVEVLFPKDNTPVIRLLGDISSRGCLYAIVIMPQNEDHKSITVNILHGTPQEHRNMPLNDAVSFISKNFDIHTRERAARRIAAKLCGPPIPPPQAQPAFNASSNPVPLSYPALQQQGLLDNQPRQQVLNIQPRQEPTIHPLQGFMGIQPQQQRVMDIQLHQRIMDIQPQQRVMDSQPQHQGVMDSQLQQQRVMDSQPQQQRVMDIQPQQQRVMDIQPQQQRVVDIQPQQRVVDIQPQLRVMDSQQQQERMNSHHAASMENDVQTLIRILANGKQLTVSELDRVIKHLEETRSKLIASNSGVTYNSDPAHPQQHLELQQKIISLFGGPANSSNSASSSLGNIGRQGTLPYDRRDVIGVGTDNVRESRQRGGEGRWGPPINIQPAASPSLNIHLGNPNIQKALENILQSGPNILKCLDVPADRDSGYSNNSNRLSQSTVDHSYSGGRTSRNTDMDSRNVSLLSTQMDQDSRNVARSHGQDSRNTMQLPGPLGRDTRNVNLDRRDIDSRLRDFDSRSLELFSSSQDLDRYHRGHELLNVGTHSHSVGQGTGNPGSIGDSDRYGSLPIMGRPFPEQESYNQRPFY